MPVELRDAKRMDGMKPAVGRGPMIGLMLAVVASVLLWGLLIGGVLAIQAA